VSVVSGLQKVLYVLHVSMLEVIQMLHHWHNTQLTTFVHVTFVCAESSNVTFVWAESSNVTFVCAESSNVTFVYVLRVGMLHLSVIRVAILHFSLY
jgi:hypothetical protein